MEASIAEVRAELQQIQNRIRVLRLSLAGISVESGTLANEGIRSAACRCKMASDLLDNLNDDLTRATCCK